MSEPSTNTCIIDECTRPIRIKKYQWCGTHYQCFLRTGDPIAKRAYSHNEGPCSVDDCTRTAKTKGMCGLHYQRSIKGQDLHAPVPEGYAECSLEGCGEPHHAGGHCATHYFRHQRTGEVGSVEKKKQPNQGKTCGGPECERAAVSKGFCASHYYQFTHDLPLMPIRDFKPKGGPCEVEACTRKAVSEGLCRTHYGRRLAGEENWDRPIARKAENGAGHVDKFGYRYIQHDGRQRKEHCVFVEQLLGRSLNGKENVHHLNGHRADNRTDGPLRLVNGKLRSGNLELWSTAQPAGQEIGPKLDWGAEIWRDYAPYGDLDMLRRILAEHGDEGERERYAGLLP